MTSRLATLGRFAGLLSPTSLAGVRFFLSMMATDCAPDCAQSMPNIGQSAVCSGTASGTALAPGRANAREPSNGPKAVYMLYYRSPLWVGSIARAGIAKPADIAGRKIGGALADGAYKLFPAYARLTDIKADSIQWQYGDLRLRETLLLK